MQELMTYVTHNRESPHNENYLRQKSKRPQTDFQTDMNFQVVVALACLLDNIRMSFIYMHQFTHMVGHKVVVG